MTRSTQQLCEIVSIIKQKRLRLVIVGSITVDCHTGQIDPMSQAFIQMSAVFAELELSMQYMFYHLEICRVDPERRSEGISGNRD